MKIILNLLKSSCLAISLYPLIIIISVLSVHLASKRNKNCKANIKKAKYIQDISKSENRFSKALTDILTLNNLPANTVELCEMHNCNLEKARCKWQNSHKHDSA